MTGIQFLTDEKGRKTAAVIDLKKHGALWEESRTGWFRNRAARKRVYRLKSQSRSPLPIKKFQNYNSLDNRDKPKRASARAAKRHA
jgi:hypothetical protein